jgi:hypothetical protein
MQRNFMAMKSLLTYTHNLCSLPRQKHQLLFCFCFTTKLAGLYDLMVTQPGDVFSGGGLARACFTSCTTLGE